MERVRGWKYWQRCPCFFTISLSFFPLSFFTLNYLYISPSLSSCIFSTLPLSLSYSLLHNCCPVFTYHPLSFYNLNIYLKRNVLDIIPKKSHKQTVPDARCVSGSKASVWTKTQWQHRRREREIVFLTMPHAQCGNSITVTQNIRSLNIHTQDSLLSLFEAVEQV